MQLEIYRYASKRLDCDEDGKTWLHVELKLCPHPFAGQNFILKHYFSSKVKHLLRTVLLRNPDTTTKE
jgi:hypothetical protein